MKIIKNICSNIMVFTLSILGMFVMFSSNVFAGDQYFWNVKIMFESTSLSSDIILDEDNTSDDERYLSCLSDTSSKKYNTNLTDSDSLKGKVDWDTGEYKKEDSCADSTWESSTSARPFTFPGVQGTNANENDKTQANAVSNYLTSSFNTSLEYLTTSDGEAFVSADTSTSRGKLALLKAIKSITNSAMGDTGTAKVTYTDKNGNSKTYSAKFSKLSSLPEGKYTSLIDKYGCTASDFREITSADGQSTIVLVSIPKGYQKNGPIENSQVNKNDSYVERLSYKHVGYMALSSYSIGIFSSEVGELYSAQGDFANAIYSFFNMILSYLLGIFGADTIDNLIYGDVEGQEYYKSIAPTSWFEGVSFLIIISYVVAISMLSIAFVKNFAMDNINSMNPAAKANVMSGLMNLMYAAVFLTMYAPAMGYLFDLNSAIVGFAKEINNGRALSGAIAAGGGFGAIITSFIFFGLTIRFNILYIIRGLYIVALYAFGPLFICGFAFGEKFKKITGNWLRELIGNIFLQSFHALILILYVQIAGSSGMITKCVLIYSFIPLSNLFRDKLMQLGGGDDNKYKGLKSNPLLQALGTVAGAGVGAAAMMAGDKIANSGGSGSNEHINIAPNTAKMDSNQKASMKDVDASLSSGQKAKAFAGSAVAGMGFLAASAAAQGLGGVAKNQQQMAANTFGRAGQFLGGLSKDGVNNASSLVKDGVQTGGILAKQRFNNEQAQMAGFNSYAPSKDSSEYIGTRDKNAIKTQFVGEGENMAELSARKVTADADGYKFDFERETLAKSDNETLQRYANIPTEHNAANKAISELNQETGLNAYLGKEVAGPGTNSIVFKVPMDAKNVNGDGSEFKETYSSSSKNHVHTNQIFNNAINKTKTED